jgi:hypothetical protein
MSYALLYDNFSILFWKKRKKVLDYSFLPSQLPLSLRQLPEKPAHQISVFSSLSLNPPLAAIPAGGYAL